jgi:hypothetical protein
MPWLKEMAKGGLMVEEDTLKMNKTLDWGRVRAPWLGKGDPQHSGRMQFYGWGWGEADAAEGAVACRPDDAQVDLALWAVGGDGAGLEEARAAIRIFLHQIWCRRLCREACAWLRSEDAQTDPERNRGAVRDCVERCSNSTWWDWSDGSRLLFWRGPWIGE